MLKTYSEYISSYLMPDALANRPCPGEHHFVSAYLLPRLFSLNKRIPDYINPDGTKSIIGDVVYYKDHEHQFSIEAKLGTIRLTKSEFNEWIVSSDQSCWPHAFIAIGTKGIGFCSWEDFRTTYISSVREKNPTWSPAIIDGGYGPQKSVNLLLSKLPDKYFCPFSNEAKEADELEIRFMDLLRSEVYC